MTVSGLSVSHYIVVEIFSISDTMLTLRCPSAALIGTMLWTLTNVFDLFRSKIRAYRENIFCPLENQWLQMSSSVFYISHSFIHLEWMLCWNLIFRNLVSRLLNSLQLEISTDMRVWKFRKATISPQPHPKPVVKYLSKRHYIYSSNTNYLPCATYFVGGETELWITKII